MTATTDTPVRLRRCTTCLNAATRPRISFDEKGRCNACVWAEEKKTAVDWAARRRKLDELCDRYRKPNGFDVLVGCSGGKDGSYVAYMLREKCGLKPLAITVAIPLSYTLGNNNLENFIESGFDHVRVTPNPVISREVNKLGFVEQGRPLYGWQINLQVALLRTALAFDIPFIMYGEDGEVEYGGSSETKNQFAYSVGYALRVYLSGHDPRDLIHKLGGKYTEKDLYWWLFPSEEEIARVDPQASHWSYFEDWDPYSHYLVAKEHCGLQERESASVGTYTNYAQTDTALFDLHMYLMYLKFGFGRCTQDVGTDIRRGAMSRKQGVQLVKVYDSHAPEEHVPAYLDYFRMTRAEYDAVLDRFANKDLFRKENGVWVPRFEVE